MMSKSRISKWMMTTALVGAAVVAGAEEAWVRFSEDGQRIVVDAEGFSKFEGISDARWKIDGKWQQVGSKNTMLKPIRETVGTTPFGDAVVSTATYGNDQFQYTLTLKRLKCLRAFTLQGVFHNLTDKDVNLHLISLLDMTKNQGGGLEVTTPADWLVTPLMHPKPAKPLSEMTGNMQEAAMFYHTNGNGFLIGPVGPPEAHVMLQLSKQGLNTFAQMDDVLVRAGGSRRSEEVIFSFEPASTSTDIWTRWVAATHGVRRNKPPVYGWCSWYDRTTKIDAKHFLDVTRTIAENPNTFGQGVIQIDDGYQVMDGDWSANEKVPDGMADLAQ
jgi:hypothetical protein